MNVLKQPVFAAVFVGVLAAGLAVADERPTTLTIATEGAYPPWNFTDADGKLIGYEIELIDELCQRMAVECTVVAQDWNGIIPGLVAGKYDAIIASMGATDEREKVVSFSSPYARSPNGFLVGTASPLADLPLQDDVFNLTDDLQSAKDAVAELEPVLSGKILGVQGGSTAASFATEMLADIVEIREYGTFEQHNLDLQAGRIDLVMANVTALASVIESSDPDTLKIAGPRFTGGVLGRGSAHAAVRKEDDVIREMLNDAIASVIDDGTNSRLSLKWFGVDIGNIQ